MKKFLIKTSIFIGIFLFAIIGVLGVQYFWVGNLYMDSYQGCLMDKVERLESINEPKIILVGNSNLVFGIRSEIIEKEIGMPVVNLGFHGSIGNRIHENMAKLNINEGDIVIVCHSDYADNDELNSPLLLLTTMEWHKDLWKIPDIKDYDQLVKTIPSYMVSTIQYRVSGKTPGITDDYCRAAFNKYGDNDYLDTHTYEEGYVFKEDDFEGAGVVSDACINRLNSYNKYIKKKGATLLVAACPVGECEYTPDHSVYKKYENELRERLECPVISDFEDYFFEPSLYYDTAYHLNAQGARLRTSQLVADIKAYFESVEK